MGTKKDAHKTLKKTGTGLKQPAKLTLPAFGLAEDILGKNSAAWATEDNGQPPAAQMSAPGPEQEVVPEKDLHLVTFRLDQEEYGVDIGRVQEIIRVGQVTAVPNAPEFIRGVINLRGRIIPVLDLRKRLALPEEPVTKHSRIMVVETGTKVLGLLVDRVVQVLRMPHSSVEAPPDDIEDSRGFVRGIGKLDARLIMIMELDRVLAKDARQAAHHAQLMEA